MTPKPAAILEPTEKPPNNLLARRSAARFQDDVSFLALKGRAEVRVPFSGTRQRTGAMRPKIALILPILRILPILLPLGINNDLTAPASTRPG